MRARIDALDGLLKPIAGADRDVVDKALRILASTLGAQG